MSDDARLCDNLFAAEPNSGLIGLHFAVMDSGTPVTTEREAGRDIDAPLEGLGNSGTTDGVDCVLERGEPDAAPQSTKTKPAAIKPTPKRTPWNRKNPYHATVVTNRVLSGPGSSKEVRHYAFALGDSGLVYEPGDGLGVRPINNPEVVDALIGRLGVSPDSTVTFKGSEQRLDELLTYSFEIGVPSMDLTEAVAERTGDDELGHVLSTGDRDSLDAWIWGKDVLDVLSIDPKLDMEPSELLDLLRPLQHRVYSIASSPLAHEGTVHVTVASVRYRSSERNHGGVCSTYLADRVGEGESAGVFLSPNKSFRLPSDDDVPVVMIGPGTGIAPFRAFLHERRARGASGRNWLFFGDQHRSSDFTYEDELTELSRDGVLNRLDLAFSRDQTDKIYVQHRMRESGKELYTWLEEGAHLYVCGDATRMAKDVDAALHDIVAEHGGYSSDRAEDYISKLRRDKRYLRDVY